ncbi:MAG TPA: hypothetical protein VNN13_00455 [Methylomirabilota bacterium]|nr:hypothetical protein [Methylomirabilota bacterium]
MGDAGVGEEGDVGDGVIADEEIVFRRVALRHFERGPAAGALASEQHGFFCRVGFVLHPEAGSRDVELVAVLLEERPLKDQRELLPVFRQKFRSLSEMGEDGVGFGEH